MEKMSDKKRKIIRIAGIVLLIVAAILIIWGISDFGVVQFFLGGICMMVGFFLTNIGFMGKMDRFVKSETVDNTADSINHILDKTKDNIKEIIPGSSSKQRVCPKCNAINDIEHTYCFDCGEKIK